MSLTAFPASLTYTRLFLQRKARWTSNKCIAMTTMKSTKLLNSSKRIKSLSSRRSSSHCPGRPSRRPQRFDKHPFMCLQQVIFPIPGRIRSRGHSSCEVSSRRRNVPSAQQRRLLHTRAVRKSPNIARRGKSRESTTVVSPRKVNINGGVSLANPLACQRGEAEVDSFEGRRSSTRSRIVWHSRAGPQQENR